jgi:hypothetical protein
MAHSVRRIAAADRRAGRDVRSAMRHLSAQHGVTGAQHDDDASWMAPDGAPQGDLCGYVRRTRVEQKRKELILNVNDNTL